MQELALNRSSFQQWPRQQQETFLNDLTDDEAEQLLYHWEFWAREGQLPPKGVWDIWLVNAGRGFGKTRIGAEWTIARAKVLGKGGRIALVGETAADVRKVMVLGESGIIENSPPWFMPIYNPSNRLLTWPNGCIAETYSAEKPDQLRGPQHHAGWADEIAKWQYIDAWDQLTFGMRLGKHPQVVATTTPRPIKIVKDLLSDPNCKVTKGTTYDNKENLAPTFLNRVIKKYEGTRLGRQELNAEMLDDNPYALWKRSEIDANRQPNAIIEFKRIVVAVDPPTTSGEDADECGIIVAGIDQYNNGYVIADRTIAHATPKEWALEAIKAYYEFNCDRLVAEVNQGGEMVETIVRMLDESISYRGVYASHAKVTRAEPVSALYEQRRISHLGFFAYLEDQMCEFDQDFDKEKMGYSPDRVDALVWAFFDLMIKSGASEPKVR